ncbi:Hypothetical protein PHPALM_16992 [Phytophthora palmivora]|uniref:Uncharacterized protein n=1 Tax=Phytophthora palmivora TaxID=4796 RepID=A0A2P4XNC8_9STRA|nr:Hypothetical protein PHPALM_16992 [Phytophthora palmivora]
MPETIHTVAFRARVLAPTKPAGTRCLWVSTAISTKQQHVESLMLDFRGQTCASALMIKWTKYYHAVDVYYSVTQNSEGQIKADLALFCEGLDSADPREAIDAA